MASDNNVKYIDILSFLIVGIETESKTADNMEFWVAWNSTAITKSEHLDALYTQESWHILQTWPLAIFLMTIDPFKKIYGRNRTHYVITKKGRQFRLVQSNWLTI